MMPNLPKNNNSKLKWWQKEIKFPIRFPKLKWWQKGALVGLILGVVEICFIMLSMMLSGRPIEPLALQLGLPRGPDGGLVPGILYAPYFLIKISIYPFYFLLSLIFGPIMWIWFPSPQPTGVIILFLTAMHLLSWIIGGIFWAFIFCILKKAAEISYRGDSQKNKR